MDIRENTFYNNKTSQYLFPVLRNYGDHFVNKMNNIYKYAIGIHDSNLKDVIGNYNILILINTNYFPKYTEEFLKWLKDQSYFIHYYNPSSNPIEKKKIIVIKIPERFYSAYDNFIIGHYSCMYNKEEMNTLFNNKESETYKILSGSSEMEENFINKLKKEFKIRKKFEIEDIQEYDLPPKCNEEIFNYSGKNCFIRKEDLF